MKIPKAKYDIGVHPFGRILKSFYHNEDLLAEHEWTYQMIKNGKTFPFWYAEEEIDKMVAELKVASII